MRVSFATTNPIKVDSVVRVLQGRGIEVEVVKLDVPEIQAETALLVAAEKAREAFRQLAAPVLVNDFAIHFDALGGFPGTFVKQATRQLGLEGYFRLLKTEAGHLSHDCTMMTALAYMDAQLDKPRVFVRATPGLISPEAYRTLPRKPKHEELIMDVFVPEGEVHAIGQMLPAEFDRWRKRPAHEKFYHDLADWLIARAS